MKFTFFSNFLSVCISCLRASMAVTIYVIKEELEPIICEGTSTKWKLCTFGLLAREWTTNLGKRQNVGI